MRNLLNKVLLVLTFFSSFIVNAQGTPGAGVTIDGHTYRTVIINGREWMAENLKATKYESGSTFQSVTLNQLLTAPITTNIQSGPYATPAYLDPAWGSANGFGKLYNFSIVYNRNQVIKSGWRIPSKQEWLDMIAYTNAETTDNMRKVEGPTDQFWSCQGNLVDQYGFSAIGVGRVNVNSANTEAVMDFVGEGSFFWSVSNGEDGQTNVSAVNINCNDINSGTRYINANYLINRRSALSVRLIKDAPLSTNTFDLSKVFVYPNPVKNDLNINTEYDIQLLEVYDMTGKVVLSTKNAKNVVDTSNLVNGIYILRISTDYGMFTQKLVKN